MEGYVPVGNKRGENVWKGRRVLGFKDLYHLPFSRFWA